MKRLLRLYPRAWRDRYEAEVGRMLDDSDAGIREAPDLVRGAIDAHVHPADVGIRPGWLGSDRVAGLLAALAGSLGLFVMGAPVLLGQSYNALLDTVSIWSIELMAVCMVGALGLLLLRHARGPLPALLGGIAFAMGVFVVAWMLRNCLPGHRGYPVTHITILLLFASVTLASMALVLAGRRHTGPLLLIGASAGSWVLLDATHLADWEYLPVVTFVGFLALGWSALRDRTPEVTAGRPS